jgi:N-terminal half of MaoC dehydratase
VTETLITDDMRALIGQVMRSSTSFPIAVSDIRKWAMAIWYPELPPPLYWDEDYAKATRWAGIIAPQEFNPFAWMAAEPRPTAPEPLPAGGYRRFADLEAPFGLTMPHLRAILQSRVIATYSPVPMRPGDVIRSDSAITEYFEREGKMGLQLYTTTSNNWYNQNGEWIKRLDTVFVRYR